MKNSVQISITELIKTFPIGKGEFTALNKINLSFNKGDFAGLVGPSGSGKTTLLNIIGSLDIPTNGTANVAPPQRPNTQYTTRRKING